MTVGSLFSGIGGFDLGFERAGFEIRWQVEIDDYATRVLEKHWPNVRRYRDVRECGANLAPVDVICGGFPCQPHSLAGRRGGSADERDLWGEFARIIRDTQPRWVVAENVPGLLSSESGRFFGRVLRDLAESGYDAEWDCLPASAFGAPHRRDRVWIIAYANGRRFQECAQLDGSAFQDPANRDTCGRYARGLRDAVADADRDEQQRRRLNEQMGRIWSQGEIAKDGDAWRTQWRTEPDVGRVAHGIPARVDRLRGLGNAIVPQIAEWIARRIAHVEATRA
jgi:DNA (cytosine-5)-methyltransferase 1